MNCLRHRFRFLEVVWFAALLATPVACVELSPESEEPSQDAPDLPPTSVRDPFASCSRPLPEAGAWQPIASPTERTRRFVAATDTATFVISRGAVRRSTNGRDFVVVSEGLGEDVNAVASTGDELFISTGSAVLRSTDEGATFEDVSGELALSLGSLRSNGQAVVATDALGVMHTWSRDNERFSAVASEDHAFVLAASDGSTVLADTALGVYRYAYDSEWTLVDTLDAWGYRDLAVVGNRSVGITLYGEIRTSNDAGATFTPTFTPQLGAAHRSVVTEDAVFVTTDRGIARSSDGITFDLLAPHEASAGAHEIAVRGDFVVASTPDVRVSVDRGLSFSPPIAMRDANLVSLTEIDGWIIASTGDRRVHGSPNGATWLQVETSDHIVREVSMDGEDVVVLFTMQLPSEPPALADGLLSYSVDGGATFDALELPLAEASTSVRAVETTNGSIFLATVDADIGDGHTGNVFASHDGGRSWHRANNGLPKAVAYDGSQRSAGVSALESLDGELFALVDGYAPHRSSDGGKTWTAAPAAGAGAAHLLKKSGEQLFLAAGVALFVWDNESDTWSRIDADGLGVARDVAHDENLTFVSTQGGVFVSDHRAPFQPLELGGQVDGLLVRGDRLYAARHNDGLYAMALDACR